MKSRVSAIYHSSHDHRFIQSLRTGAAILLTAFAWTAECYSQAPAAPTPVSTDSSSPQSLASPSARASGSPAVVNENKKPAPKPVWEIDFTPRYCEVNWHELTGQKLYLQNGPLRVFLSAPQRWELTGNKNALQLKYLAAPLARAEVRPTSARLPVPMTPEWAEEARKRLFKTVAGEARDVQFLDEKAGTLDVNSWRSFEQRATYSYYGTAMTLSVCTLRFSPDYAVEVVCTAPSANFAEAYSGIKSMMISWTMPPQQILQQMVSR